MKKFMFVFTLLVFAGFSVNAQSCSKSAKKGCCKAKAAAAAKADASTDTAVASAYMEAAEMAAEADESIMKRVCAKSGSVGFYKKNVCSKSGKISYDEVNYDADQKTFVNVSPSEVQSAMMEGEVINVSEEAPVSKKACAGKSAKSCAKKCAKKAEEGTK